MVHLCIVSSHLWPYFMFSKLNCLLSCVHSCTIYDICLFTGGFAFVYVAQEVTSGKYFALKRLLSSDADVDKIIRQEIGLLVSFENKLLKWCLQPGMRSRATLGRLRLRLRLRVTISAPAPAPDPSKMSRRLRLRLRVKCAGSGGSGSGSGSSSSHPKGYLSMFKNGVR